MLQTMYGLFSFLTPNCHFSAFFLSDLLICFTDNYMEFIHFKPLEKKLETGESMKTKDKKEIDCYYQLN